MGASTIITNLQTLFCSQSGVNAVDHFGAGLPAIPSVCIMNNRVKILGVVYSRARWISIHMVDYSSLPD